MDGVNKWLLIDRTTGKNIRWATDVGREKEIKSRLVGMIKRRADKSVEEQKARVKAKGEVFTPVGVVREMNRLVDSDPVTEENWKDYVRLRKLEITCGEASFIVSRYDPIQGNFLEREERVGFLDEKMRIVGMYCESREDWIYWAKEAFKASV